MARYKCHTPFRGSELNVQYDNEIILYIHEYVCITIGIDRWDWRTLSCSVMMTMNGYWWRCDYDYDDDDDDDVKS